MPNLTYSENIQRIIQDFVRNTFQIVVYIAVHSVCQLYILCSTLYVQCECRSLLGTVCPVPVQKQPIDCGARRAVRPPDQSSMPDYPCGLSDFGGYPPIATHFLRQPLHQSYRYPFPTSLYFGLFGRGLLELIFVLDWTIILMAKAM